MRRKILLLTFSVLCWSLTTIAQKTVTGTITDSEGNTMIGVNILESGTTNGTVTDIDGNYSITVADGNAVLLYSYTGFATVRETVGERTSISLVIEEDSQKSISFTLDTEILFSDLNPGLWNAAAVTNNNGAQTIQVDALNNANIYNAISGKIGESFIVQFQ